MQFKNPEYFENYELKFRSPLSGIKIYIQLTQVNAEYLWYNINDIICVHKYFYLKKTDS